MTDISKSPVRLRNITATDMSTLFGLNKYETPKSLLEKKVNPQRVENNHVRRGKLKEPSVLEAFLLDMNIHTTRHEGPTIELPEYRIAATPDAYIKGTLNVVEAKSIASHNFDKWYMDLPTNYHIQVFTQMMVVGSDFGLIGALEEGHPSDCEYRFIAWRVSRVPAIEELMIEEVTRFWESVATGKQYRVNSKNKKLMDELMDDTKERVYPLTIPKPKEVSAYEEFSRIVSSFK